MENSIIIEETSSPPLDQVAEGEELFRAGRLDEARARFQAAAEVCPVNALEMDGVLNSKSPSLWYDNSILIARSRTWSS